MIMYGEVDTVQKEAVVSYLNAPSGTRLAELRKTVDFFRMPL
jgi:hypothetical protein